MMPFSDLRNGFAIPFNIISGLLPSWPTGFAERSEVNRKIVKFCQHCWDSDPAKRPEMDVDVLFVFDS